MVVFRVHAVSGFLVLGEGFTVFALVLGMEYHVNRVVRHNSVLYRCLKITFSIVSQIQLNLRKSTGESQNRCIQRALNGPVTAERPVLRENPRRNNKRTFV